MTLIEAIHSGRRFRRNTRNGYFAVFNDRIYTESNGVVTLSVSDLTAEDWEVEVKTVTISYEELKNALNAANIDVGVIARLLGL